MNKRKNRMLNQFRGDLPWIHQREGHSGVPYWPGGESGVTLDPGIDLGYADPELIKDIYKDILTPNELEVIGGAIGKHGISAHDMIKNSSALRAIKISRGQALSILPYVMAPYWKKITKRFPVLLEENTISAVQTVMLSIAYNRGPYNRNLEALTVPLETKNWDELYNLITNMQQDHKLLGIRKRRRLEADLIKTALC
jgi:GH24 family phage-related lysozyme (muramidase)